VAISAGGGGDGQAGNIAGVPPPVGSLSVSRVGRPASGREPMDGYNQISPCRRSSCVAAFQMSSQEDQIDGSSRRQYSPPFLRLSTLHIPGAE
jgi:hypothetical protein